MLLPYHGLYIRSQIVYMATLFFVLSAFVLLVIKFIWLSNRNRQLKMPSFLLVSSGLLFVIAMLIFIYFSFLIKDKEGLRGYGFIGWVLVTASLSGLFFVLFVKKEAGINILRNLGIVVLLPILVFSAITASHIDDKSSRVFYEDHKYRIQKKDLVMYMMTLPELVVKHGITETYYSIDSKIRIPQENVLSAKVEEVSADSVNISFYHKPDSTRNIPNPFIVGLRINLAE